MYAIRSYYAIYVIIVLSCIPPALEFWKARRRARASRGA